MKRKPKWGRGTSVKYVEATLMEPKSWCSSCGNRVKVFAQHCPTCRNVFLKTEILRIGIK